MSTTTVTLRETSTAVDIEALRELQDQLRRAERTEAANQVIVADEDRFNQAVSRCDEAARTLPDFDLTVPDLPMPAGADTGDPVQLERYALQVHRHVEEFTRQLDTAIAQAARLLERRKATAEAWQDAADLEELIDHYTKQLADQTDTATLPARPNPDNAALEAVKAYKSALQALYRTLKQQWQNQQRAVELSGQAVTAQDAQTARKQHQTGKHEQARQNLISHRDAELARRNMTVDDLPQTAGSFIEDLLTQAGKVDQRDAVTRRIDQVQKRRNHKRWALEALQNAPDLVLAEPHLAVRWKTLTTRLQRVANGLGELLPLDEDEFNQIHKDAKRLVQRNFAAADLIQALREQGFETSELADGTGWRADDQDNPDVWLKVTTAPDEALKQDQKVGCGAQIELQTDAEYVQADESAKIQSLCERVNKASSLSADQVEATGQEQERSERIPRKRRPACKKKTFAQTLSS